MATRSRGSEPLRPRLAMWGAIAFAVVALAAPRVVGHPLLRNLTLGWMLGVLAGLVAAQLYAQIDSPQIFMIANEDVHRAMRISVPSAESRGCSSRS